MQTGSSYIPLQVTDVHEEVKNFVTLQFSAGANVIRYEAGQYLTLVHLFNGKEERRSYSITSSPILAEPLTIGVKRIDNGIFSRFLVDKIKPGDVLYTTGAAGRFILPQNITDSVEVILLAAGSGITPIYSLLKTILYGYPFLRVTLIYSNHSPQSAAFTTQLETLAETFNNRFTLHLLFSNNKNVYRARLHRETLQQLVKHTNSDYKATLAYVCGPLNYRRMCIYTLEEMGLPKNNIKKETFDTTPVSTHQQPPDTKIHKATIYYGGSIHQIDVRYPETILKAAKKHGIVLPYSCEAGKCSTCAMRCTAGTVWMSYNEVLTPKEIEEGWVLTCTGHPVFGDVELRG